ncbi:MAG: ATP-binding protein [Bacteroidota bacterium]
MMHKLLQRQLRRLERKYPDPEARYEALLATVSQTYTESDGERRKKDRSVVLMSEELMEAHQNNLKRSEAYLSGILENVADGIVITDQFGMIKSQNARAEAIFELDGQSLMGEVPEKLFPPAEQERFSLAWQEVVQHGSFSLAGEAYFLGQRTSGDTFPMELSISAIHLPEETWYLFLVKDISERMAAQRDLVEAKEQAEQAAHAKARFLSNMSHEIRTPMNAVLGLTDLLMVEEPRPEQLEILKILRFSGDNLLVIINDILDYSKIESGKVELENIEVHLADLIRSIKESLLPKAKEKGLSLTLENPKSLPAVLLTDPVRLSQVLTNLLGNAIKFTSEGDVFLRIQEVGREADQIRLRFEVEDTGIGIEPHQLAHIFDSFTQSNLSTTREYGGTGLGLAISKNLVEIFGGELQVRSILEQGTCFWFDISVGYRQHQVPQATPSLEKKADFESLAGVRILLVEDNKVNQLVASKHLKKWDLTVSVANHGAEAVEMVQQEDFDVVLMDLHMPVMDGFSAAKAIRALPDPKFQELPIIALTASAMLPVREQVQSVGMNDFVSKPFHPRDLYQAIASYSQPILPV